MILGESPAIHELNRLIRRVTTSKTNVLILGESGTGKELVARKIHDSGLLKNFPFVPVNCGAIPENLIESEMFGHQRGSFTGAVSEKSGLFEVAHRGTLFLDEVGELSLPMQVKLLRAIQERIFRRVGGVEDIQVDVRIIAATNRDLESAVAKGTFREDLYYRLNVISIRTPPLRDRRGDVTLLAEHFLRKFASQASKGIEGFEPHVLQALENYRWPGNVRELENCIERSVTMESGQRISLDSLSPQLRELANPEVTTPHRAGDAPLPSQGSHSANFAANLGAEIRLPAPHFGKGKVELDQVISEVERIYITAALAHAGGVKKRAADILGITFRSLRYRLVKLGL